MPKKKWPSFTVTKKPAIPKAKKKKEKQKVANKSQSAASCEEQNQQPKDVKLKRPEPKEEAASTSTVGRIQRIRNAIGIKRSSSKNRTNDVKKKKAKNGIEENFDKEPKKTMKGEERVMEELTQPKVLSEQLVAQMNTTSSTTQDVLDNSSDFSDAKSDFDSTGKEGIEVRPGHDISAPARNAEDNEQCNEGTSFEHDPGCMQNQGLSYEHKLNQSVVSIKINLCSHYAIIMPYYRELSKFFAQVFLTCTRVVLSF